MIEQYFSEKERDSQKYDFCFVYITEDKAKDDELICELQKNILRAYCFPAYFQQKRRNLDRKGLETYIKGNVIPNNANRIDLSVRNGDFGEIFVSLIIEYFYKKEPFYKLRWKVNSDKSVFGTDIVAFDSLDNPTEISYYEVKTRKNPLKKEPLNKDCNEFITVIAYKSLEKDMNSNTEAILDFISKFYFRLGEYDKSKVFSDLVDGVKSVNKNYEIFIITDSNILSKDYQKLLSALQSIPKTITPLSVTFIFIDNLQGLITDIWETIAERGAEFIEANAL